MTDFITRHRIGLWWLCSLFAPAVFLILTIAGMAAGEWGYAFNSLLFTASSTFWISVNVRAFQTGYRWGRLDALEALHKSEEQEEFLRLITIDPPKPWQR